MTFLRPNIFRLYITIILLGISSESDIKSSPKINLLTEYHLLHQDQWIEQVLNIDYTTDELRESLGEESIKEHVSVWNDIQFLVKLSEYTNHAHDILYSTHEPTKLVKVLDKLRDLNMDESKKKTHSGDNNETIQSNYNNEEVQASSEFIKELPKYYRAITEEEFDKLKKSLSKVKNTSLLQLLWQVFLHFYALLPSIADRKQPLPSTPDKQQPLPSTLDKEQLLQQTQQLFGKTCALELARRIAACQRQVFTMDIPYRKPLNIVTRVKSSLPSDSIPLWEWNIQDWMNLTYYLRSKKKLLESIVTLAKVINLQKHLLPSTIEYFKKQLDLVPGGGEKVTWPAVTFNSRLVIDLDEAADQVRQANIIINNPPIFEPEELDKLQDLCEQTTPKLKCFLFSCLVFTITADSKKAQTACLNGMNAKNSTKNKLLLPNVELSKSGTNLKLWLLKIWNLTKMSQDDQEQFILDAAKKLLELESNESNPSNDTSTN